MMRNRHASDLFLTLIVVLTLVGCGGGNDGPAPVDIKVSKVLVTPSSIVLAGLNDTQTLSAQAYNSAGEPIDADIEWSSNGELAVVVDQDGVAVARTRVGSALLTARAGGIEAAPVLAAVVLPAVNVRLIPDEQFVGEPVPVDPNAEFDLGYQYRIGVRAEVAPAVGNILAASGETPVAGRVVAVERNDDGSFLVILEVIPIDDVFAELVIDEEFDITGTSIEIPQSILKYYDVSVDADGSRVFEPIPGVDLAASRTAAQPAARSGILSAKASAVSFKDYGAFECAYEGSFPLKFSASLPRITVAPALSMPIKYNSLTGGLELLSVKGQLFGTVDTTLQTQLAIQAKVDCSATLFYWPAPINGALAVYITTKVPIGGGFALGGKLEVSAAEFKLQATPTASLEIGLLCPLGLPDCVYLSEGSADANVNLPKLGFPNGYVSGEISTFSQAYLKVGLAVGPALTSRFNFTFVEFKAGPKLTYDVDSVLNQINDKAFSSYKIDIDGEIGPSIDALKVLTNLKRYLKLKPVTPKVKILSVELDKSAKSDNFVIDNDNPAIGDSVEFSLGLVSGTERFLFGYDIEKINLYHVSDPANPLPVFIMSVRPTSQSTKQFNFSWVVDRQGGDIYAFAATEFPVLASLGIYGLNEVGLAKVSLNNACPISNSTVTFDSFSNSGAVGIGLSWDGWADLSDSSSSFSDVGINISFDWDRSTGAIKKDVGYVQSHISSDPASGVNTGGSIVGGTVIGRFATVTVEWRKDAGISSDSGSSWRLPRTTTFELELDASCVEIDRVLFPCIGFGGVHDTGPDASAIAYGVNECRT